MRTSIGIATLALAFVPVIESTVTDDELRSTLVERVLAVQRADPGSAAFDDLEQKIAGLGLAALPDAFDVLARRIPLATDGAPPIALDGAGEGALYAALRTWPRSEVEAWIRARALETDALDDRLGALRILGRIGAESTLVALGDVLASIPPAEIRHPAAQQAIEASLGALLERDAAALGSFDALVERVDRGALPAIARVLAASNDWRALLLLESLLGDDVALDIEILSAIGNDRMRDRAALERAREWARLRFQVVDPALRRQATITAGQLLDAQSVPQLIDALEKDSDPRVQRSAHWALREITGLGWGPEAERWRSWFERESAWFEDDAPVLIEGLADDARVVQLLRELAAHDLFRDALAEQLAELVDHEDALIARAAIGAHVGLASSFSVEPLIDALGRESRPGIRAALANALAHLTGETLGPDSARWDDWLDTAY